MKRLARLVVLGIVVAVAYSTGALTDARATATALWDEHLAGHFDLPFGTSSSAQGGDDEFQFAASTATGAPVTWNACAPINIVVNPSGAPDGALQDLQDAVTDIAAASGLDLTIVSTTDTPLEAGWGTHAQAGYDGWAPALIGWAPPSSGLIDTGVGGRTTTVRVGDAYVSAMIVFNSELDASRPSGAGRPGTRGALYRHELGHLVGLAHVDNTGELMHPSAAFGGAIAEGDRQGLVALGSQPCTPAPAPAW